MTSSSILEKVSGKELELLSHKDIVRYGLFCAEQVRESWKDIEECVVAINTAERWLKGEATAEECGNAAYTAYTATSAATYTAAYTAASAAYTAASPYTASAYAYACAATNKPKSVEAQRAYYKELLHFDDIAEKALLEGITI